MSDVIYEGQEVAPQKGCEGGMSDVIYEGQIIEHENLKTGVRSIYLSDYSPDFQSELGRLLVDPDIRVEKITIGNRTANLMWMYKEELP